MRDVLHVDDLLRAYEAATFNPDKVRAQAFNVGGGPTRVLSLAALIEMPDRKIPLKGPTGDPATRRSASATSKS